MEGKFFVCTFAVMKSLIAIIAAFALLLPGPQGTGKATGSKAVFSSTVHDFGSFRRSDGPQNCTFEVTNTGNAPLTILSVISSCGCTGVKWTREELGPGEKGVIQATYDNQESPGAFDKTLTVYLSDIKKPVILHLRGVVKK